MRQTTLDEYGFVFENRQTRLTEWGMTFEQN